MADIEDIIVSAEQYFTSDDFLIPANNVLVVIKVIAAIAIVLLIIDFILLAIRTGFYKNFYLANVKGGPYISLPEGKIKKRWKKIINNVNSKNSNSNKLAIIEADKLLDHVLDMGGFVGANYDEQLANVNDGQIINIEEIRKAHKVRQYIVDDAQYVVSHDEAKDIVKEYEKALEDLDVKI